MTVAETRPWLRVPGLPFLDLPVVPDRVPVVKRSRPSVTLRPVGRRHPVVLSDVLQAGSGSLSLLTADEAEADAVAAALEEAPVIFLVMPGTRFGARYLSVSGLTDDEETGTFEFDFEIVDRPEGGLYGDPTLSYQTLLDTFDDYTAVLGAEDTYLDVLRGV